MSKRFPPGQSDLVKATLTGQSADKPMSFSRWKLPTKLKGGGEQQQSDSMAVAAAMVAIVASHGSGDTEELPSNGAAAGEVGLHHHGERHTRQGFVLWSCVTAVSQPLSHHLQSRLDPHRVAGLHPLRGVANKAGQTRGSRPVWSCSVPACRCDGQARSRLISRARAMEQPTGAPGWGWKGLGRGGGKGTVD